jgi:hypothetical protein
MMHAVHHGRAPAYMADIVKPVSALSGRANLRSTNNKLYDVPRCKSAVGITTVSVAGPAAWNSLSTAQRKTDDLNKFKRLLKTELFRQVYAQQRN